MRYNQRVINVFMIEIILTQLIFVLLLLLPGLLITITARRKFDIFDIPLYLALSFALFVLPITLGFILHTKIAYIFIIYILPIIGFLTYLVMRSNLTGKQLKRFAKRDKLSQFSLMLILYSVIFYLIYRFLPLYMEGDMPFHLAHIRNIALNGALINAEAILKVPNQTINPAYAYNLWYGLSATVSNIFKIDVIDLFRGFNPLLLVISALTIGRLAKTLENDKKFIIFSVLSFGALIIIFRSIDGMIMPFPNRIGYLIFMPLAISLYFEYLRDNSKSVLMFLTASIVTSSLIHNMAFVYILLSIIAFCTIEYLRSRDGALLRNSVRIVFISTILAIPFYLLKIEGARAFSEFVGMKAIPKGALPFWNGLYYYGFSSLTLERIGGILILVIFLIVLYSEKKDWPKWFTYSISSLVPIIFIMHNPLIAPIFTKVISDSYTRRMWLMFPTAIIYGSFLRYVISSKLKLYNTIATFSILVLVLFLSPINLGERDYNYYVSASNRFDSIISPAAEYINKNVPPDSVIATDMGSGYQLTGRTDNYVVSVVSSHTSIYANQKERQKDNYDLMLGRLNYQEMRKIIDKYQVDYIVIARKFNHARTNGFVYDGKVLKEKLKNSKEYNYLGKYGDYYFYEPTWR